MVMEIRNPVESYREIWVNYILYTGYRTIRRSSCVQWTACIVFTSLSGIQVKDIPHSVGGFIWCPQGMWARIQTVNWPLNLRFGRNIKETVQMICYTSMTGHTSASVTTDMICIMIPCTWKAWESSGSRCDGFIGWVWVWLWLWSVGGIMWCWRWGYLVLVIVYHCRITIAIRQGRVTCGGAVAVAVDSTTVSWALEWCYIGVAAAASHITAVVFIMVGQIGVYVI